MEERPRYRNGILVYTAQDIEDDIYSGMDPDCLFVGLAKYEALRAELARVKAESLRVVVDGETCQPQDLYPTQFVLRDGRVWVTHPGTRDIVDITNNNRVAVPYDVTVQPVRLELWEDE